MRTPLLVVSLGGLAALATSCTAEPDRPWVATLSLSAAFPYIKEACFEVAFARGAVRELCGEVVDGRFLVETSVACDPAVATVRTTLRLARASRPYEEDVVLADPCGTDGCALDIGCGTGPTEVTLTYADDATNADWTSTHVATSSGWFGARFATCDDETDPIILLKGPDGVRRETAVLGFVVATELASPVVVLAATPVITCGGDVHCRLPLYLVTAPDGGGHGTVEATCSDGSTVAYHVYAGEQDLNVTDLVERYLSVAIRIADLIDAGHVDCRLTYATTLSDGPLALGPADAHPVASTHAPLIDADGAIACGSASFDDYGGEDPALLSVDFVRGWNLAPLGEAWRFVPELCNSFDGATLTSDCD